MTFRETDDLSIVAIGASAGGLEALRALFSALASDAVPAFVVVQHLSPSGPSHMADLLAKVTELPVATAEDGTPLRSGHVHLMPPGRYMSIDGDKLRVTEPPAEDRPPHPIDHLFSSLADAVGDRAVGVILSGTGSDGTDGAGAIRSAGGLVIAQDDGSAAFPGMPDSAQRAGHVDLVLPPHKIAAVLMDQRPTSDGADGADEEQEDAIDRIVATISEESGIRFADYRPTTIRRRLERRRLLTRAKDLTTYAERLEHDGEERAKLLDDMLIHVTHFFRDPDLFAVLKEEVWPRILEDKGPDDPVRVWIPACSTGQEAYSLAMTLVEHRDEAGLTNPIQVFATDVSERVLTKARKASYGPDIEKEVDEKRLARFFDRHEDGYRVKTSLRDLCVFARHDVTNDPPFLRLDMISCRNLLIYLSPDLQERVVQMFHHALVPGGFLILGRSEAVGEGIGESPLFSAVDKVRKVYERRPGPSSPPMFDSRPAQARDGEARPHPRREPEEDRLRREADRIVLADYAPPSVLVDDDLHIVQIRGDTNPYLRLPEGAPSYDLLNMVPDILSVELRDAVQECRESLLPVHREGVRFRIGKGVRAVDLHVLPLHRPSKQHSHFLVLFEATASEPISVSGDSTKTPESVHENEFLRRELAAARSSMQAVIDNQASANRELRNAIEEAVSSNEELQSTNEELESAKEELQAMNEEMTTLNEELRNQNEELKHLKEYAEAIVDTVRHPLVVLGKGQTVKSANDSFYEMFDTSPERATGVPLERLGTGRFDMKPLTTLLERVFEEGATIQGHETGFHARDGHRHQLSIDARHLTTSNGNPLVLVAMEDITDREAATEAQREADLLRGAVEEAERFNRAISHDLRTPLKAITGLTEHLVRRMKDGDPADVETLQTIAQSAARMKRSIDGMMRLSRASRAEVHRQAVDASDLAKTLIEKHAEAADIEVHIDVETDLRIQADPQLLETLLDQIIENAVRHVRPVRGPRIALKEVENREQREYVISDNGVGFPPMEAERMFEPFVRLRLDDEHEGTGVGLALVRRIAQKHCGHAWAEGSPKKGASIHFTLGEEAVAE